MALFDALKPFFAVATAWPDLKTQVGECAHYLTGNVLNAGAGERDISSLVKGKIFNQDIPGGKHNKNIHIYSPLHTIPVDDGFFDAIFCNAVLEHVENPSEVMAEFHRVLKKGGYLFLSVPFLQPEHLDPTDYWRYTLDGLKHLTARHHFEVIKGEGQLTVYHTIGWIVQEWLTSKKTIAYTMLRCLLFPILRYLCKHSKTHIHGIASAYCVLARKM